MGVKIYLVIFFLGTLLIQSCGVKVRVVFKDETNVNAASITKICDCPEEKIINRFPTIGSTGKVREYYIYQNERREIDEFDKKWVSLNCEVQVTIAS